MIKTRFVSLLFLCAVLLAPSFSSSAATQDVNKLPAPVQQALQRFKLDGNGLSILVKAVDSNKIVLQHNADVPRNPASTIKLLTSFAALDLLTPSHRWVTDIHGDGDLQNGALNGDLWMIGGGDPFLPLERLWLMVHQLRMTGLSTIHGDLYIDQSLFEPVVENPAAFDNQGLRAYNVVPAPLVSNFNVSLLLFRPSSISNRVDVEVIPDLPGLDIKNNLRTANTSCRGYNRGIAMNLNTEGQLILDGRFPARCKIYGMSRSVMNRDTYTAELFRMLWRQAGGVWNGTLRTGNRSFEDKPLLAFESVSLSEAVRSINKYSNNLMTRMLFLYLSVDQQGSPGSTEKSRAAINAWLDRQNLNRDGLFIDNGAGSSRQTRATARQFSGLLSHAWQSAYMPELLASMAVTGQDGTFSRRHVSGPLNGRAHMKTGRLDHVVAMAGYLQAKSNKRYVVVVQHNNTDVHRGSGHAVQDALLKWLYSRY